MPSSYIRTSIDGQSIKLSNLDKLLYPELGIVKAEVIEYIMKVGPFMLPHIKDRPLTLIRYPDGVEGKSFYAKNKPRWTPKWVPSFQPPWDQGNTFVVVQKVPELVWLANLAALEIHPMVIRMNRPTHPDQFIFDLDPDEGFTFENLKSLALELKEHVSGYGYFPFVKTSGGKGLHIVIPLLPHFDFVTVIAGFKALLKPFIAKRSKYTTLQVHKHKREGKVLIDIYRNYQGNSCIAPYSLRGKLHAPVSMPVTWEELTDINSSKAYNINNAPELLKFRGDVWKDLESFAVHLHTQKPTTVSTMKTALSAYDDKRDFNKSPEPESAVDDRINGKYVIQLHDASNLHYDLRLGMQGVLKSWAIPKGLPFLTGIKRLCIQTEDHPPKYYDFEGVIPKEEYGGGEMWVFDQGAIHWHTQKSNKLEFTLSGKRGQRHYLLYQIKDNQWLMERKDQPGIDWIETGIQPMLSDTRKSIPGAGKYFFEIKWDGIRSIIYKRNKTIRIISRSGRDITAHFPDLVRPDDIDVEEVIMDAEIVCLDDQGRPIFADVISRMHTIGKASIDQVRRKKPATCYFFDILWMDGHMLTNEVAERRHAYLNPLVKVNKYYRISDRFEDGQALWEAAKAMKLEGIMAKLKTGKYLPGQRSSNWLKIKFRSTIDCQILGFTKGSGDRAPYFGSLQLAENKGNELIFRGRVGTGFNMEKLKKITTLLTDIATKEKPIDQVVEEEKNTTWVEPKYFTEIEYASMTDNGTLREPVFKSIYIIDANDQREYLEL
ncbi:MAG: non-homologous end-joining DNA ligase [Bacteroidia bacterium]|nr:non-homologous end-joining DNA ligase [Bacteroidia bacterium]